MSACRAVTCCHPRTTMPEPVAHLAHRFAIVAFDYLDRTARERIALERARREHPGRAAEMRRLESVQRASRLLDWGQR